VNNSQLIHQIYDAFNARNIDGVLSVLTEDVDWANGMDGGYVHGREAIRAYWTDQWSTIDPHVDPITITQAEDGATVVDVHQVVRDLRGQVVLDETVRHVFRIERGLISRFDIGSESQLSAVVHGA
jgi:hypothetical protein